MQSSALLLLEFFEFLTFVDFSVLFKRTMNLIRIKEEVDVIVAIIREARK